jgi:hypothetical protein
MRTVPLDTGGVYAFPSGEPPLDEPRPNGAHAGRPTARRRGARHRRLAITAAQQPSTPPPRRILRRGLYRSQRDALVAVA